MLVVVLFQGPESLLRGAQIRLPLLSSKCHLIILVIPGANFQPPSLMLSIFRRMSILMVGWKIQGNPWQLECIYQALS